MEKEDYANYLFVVSTWNGYTYLPKKWGFINGRYLAAEYINSACNLFTLYEPNERANKDYFRTLFTKPEIWDKLHKLNDKSAKEMFVFGRKIKKLNVTKLSNRQLLNLMRSFIKVQLGVHVTRGPMFLMETPVNFLTDYLYNYLEECYSENKPAKIKPAEAFQTLVTPTRKSILTIEREELINIAKTRDLVKRKSNLIKHAKKYEWLEYGLQGKKLLEADHFNKEIKIILKQNPKNLLKEISQASSNLLKNQKNICQKYKIGNTHQKIFEIVRNDFYTRLNSKYAQFYGYYCIEGLLKEIGKRCGLSLEQVRFLAPEDYKKALIDGKDYSQITSERQKYSLHISDKGKTSYWAGAAAKKIMSRIKFYRQAEKSGTGEIIKGQAAYSGKAKGRVKIINTIQEMAKMHAGNILVSHMTNPDIVPAMKLASSIVTDLGGITCHAAIVARELKKPCVIGTKTATQVLKDGDLVEVDATKGIVKKL